MRGCGQASINVNPWFTMEQTKVHGSEQSTMAGQVEVSGWGWCTSVAALAVMMFVYINGLRSRKRLPPGPQAWPLVGNLFQLGRNPHLSFARMAAKYGPLISVRVGRQITVVASSPEMAQEILKKQDHIFGNRIISHAAEANRYVHTDISLLQLGPHYRNTRKIYNTILFTNSKLDSLQPLRDQQLERTLRHVADAAAAGQAVDVRRVAFGCTLNLMATMLFGGEIFDRKNAASQMREFQEAVLEVMQTLALPNLSDFFPVLKRIDPQGVHRRAKAAFRKLESTFVPMVEERSAEAPEQAAARTDLLASLLQLQNAEFGIDDVGGFVSAMLIAGTDTVTVTTEWAMAELMRNPDILRRCQAELDEVVGRERRVVEGDAKNLPFVHAVIKETYRMHPAGPLVLPHRAGDDTEVGGYFVPKDARVLVNVWAINHDPSVWKDAEKFDPERFLRRPELDYRGNNFDFIPFGSGRRMCVGMPLAWRMVFLLVASLLQGFEWSLPPGMEPSHVNLTERFSLALGMDVPLRIYPSLRLPPHLY